MKALNGTAFMTSGRFIAATTTALSMLGMATAADLIAVRPVSDVPSVGRCINQEFAANGFEVAAANNNRVEGRVIGSEPGGPTVAIVFNAAHDSTVMFDQSTMPLRTAQSRLGAIARLAGTIKQFCLH